MVLPVPKKLKATVPIVRLSHQPKYRPFEEIIAATLLLMTPRNIPECVCVAL